MSTNKPVLLDGAVGTTLWEIADSCGVEKVPVWIYNIEHPEFVSQLHKRYIEAGAKIILSNTFGANPDTVKRASKLDIAEVVKAGVRIAKESVKGTDVKVCLSVGPLSQLMEPYGDLEEEEVEDQYRQQIGAGMEEKPDLILLQTFIDVEMMKVALRVAKSYDVPVFCSMSFEPVGKTIMGQSVKDVVEGLSPLKPDAIGLNCSLGPASAVPIIKQFREYTDLPLIFKPNAGKPISVGITGTVPYTAEQFAQEVAPALDFVSYIGGCCGCNDSFISTLKQQMTNA
ncbi:MAG: homocysteine S-methyltransferase family protein [Sphaerochaetaceae bacterium]|nr:homocysteine S-methyltransferase family protein [Sphaerochaetaceae bacterium]